jgi:hypothetical protein
MTNVSGAIFVQSCFSRASLTKVVPLLFDVGITGRLAG